MTSPDVLAYQGTPDGLSLPAEYYDAVLFVASERDPDKIADRLLTQVADYPRVYVPDVTKAIDMGRRIFFKKTRLHDDPPEGEARKPLEVHTVGSAYVDAVVFGPAGTTTVKLVRDILHDGTEDGEWGIGTDNVRPVTARDIRWHMGTEIGPQVASEVEMLSRVRDIPDGNGGLVRVDVLPEEYNTRLRTVGATLPERGLEEFKTLADFAPSALDPIIPLPRRRRNREKKVVQARSLAETYAARNPMIADGLNGIAFLAERSLLPNATPDTVRAAIPMLRRVGR